MTVHPTAIVEDGAVVPDDAEVGPFTVIGGNVVLGQGCRIGADSLLGSAAGAGHADPAAPCVVGAGSVVRSHAVVYSDVVLGDGFESGHRVTIREGTRVGRDVRVGTLCDLQGRLTIGDHARLHSNVFVAMYSTIREYAWLFPHVVLTNDPHPPSDTCTIGPTIEPYAVVAARAVLMPGVVIGRDAVVGAAALVTKDVPEGALVTGVPARVVGMARDVTCKEGRLDPVYPWRRHFSRGYEGAFPEEPTP